MGFIRLRPEEITERSNLLQTAFWAGFKSRFGWKAEAVSDGSTTLLVLFRKIRLFGWYGYIPHAPQSPPGVLLADYCREILAALDFKPFVLRFDLPWPEGGYEKSVLKGLRKSPSDIQVPDTVILPLEEDEGLLLAGMKQKTRYNIRLAAKKGVEVSEAGLEELAEWYEMYRITAERDKIAIHSFEYYKTFFETSSGYPELDVKLYLARHEQDLLAGIMVVRHGKRATYPYGASSNVKRNLMPAYALQWRAIRDAKKAGCVSYDMAGIPAADDPKHPMHGLWRFKTGFGGAIEHRPGCWDYACKPFLYNLFRLAEKLRCFYYKVWKKR